MTSKKNRDNRKKDKNGIIRMQNSSISDDDINRGVSHQHADRKKIMSQIFIGAVAGILSSLALTCVAIIWQFFIIPKQEINTENQFLYRLYISITDEYIQSKIGVPYIKENNLQYVENYYLLNDVVLKTISNNGSVIAFFITSQNKKRRIPFNFAADEIIIGRYTYSDIPMPNPVISAEYYGNYRGCYYIERYETGRAGMYNDYVCASFSYGFYDDNSTELMLMNNEYNINKYTTEEKENARKKAKPNTFGVIKPEYSDRINIFLHDDTLDQFHALDSVSNIE